MAEATCSGSTPLKSLADRALGDRSTQQDRYVQGPVGFNQFRSRGPAPGANAEHAYSGFAGGMAIGGPSPGVPVIEGLVHPGVATSSPVMMRATPAHHQSPTRPLNFADPQYATNSSNSHGAQSWVNDFAMFDASSRQPGPVNAPGQAVSITQSHFNTHQGSVFRGPNFATAFSGAMAPHAAGAMSTGFPNHSATMEQGRQENAATVSPEAEFDKAMAQWMAMNSDGETIEAPVERLESEPGHVQATDSAAHWSQATGESLIRNSMTEDLPSLARLNLETQDPQTTTTTTAAEASQEQHDQPDSSDVSEAARQLLETVKHEDGEKWQQSRFLHLMREFRDGTKSIVDDEIREAR